MDCEAVSVIEDILAKHVRLGAYACRKCLSRDDPCDVQELGHEVGRLRVLLKRYEWSAVSAFGDRVCPFCEATRQEGHGHSANPHSPRPCWLEAKP